MSQGLVQSGDVASDTVALRRLIADAERYRWLREQKGLYFDAGSFEWTGGYFPEELDKAVDRAIKESRDAAQGESK